VPADNQGFEASDNRPDPDVIAQEIVEDLEAALGHFREIVGAATLRGKQWRTNNDPEKIDRISNPAGAHPARVLSMRE
jgi:hypothetical protein